MLVTTAPVRYSVGQADYDPDIGRRVRVFLNGSQVLRVIEYDCEAGTVDRFVEDENGQIVIDRVRGEAVRELLHGAVTAELAD